jgi:hypothetical protein
MPAAHSATIGLIEPAQGFAEFVEGDVGIADAAGKAIDLRLRQCRLDAARGCQRGSPQDDDGGLAGHQDCHFLPGTMTIEK